MHLRDYTLEQVVYEGPETRVYRAVHRPSATRVVIKLPVADAPSSRVLGRLVHEHLVLVKLEAIPGVPRVRELVQESGTAALVLSDPGVRSLDHLLAERGRLPVPVALRLGQLIARVLSHVHAAGVTHKDVKPQNVLVEEGCEEIILLDFGIASVLSREATEASVPEALEGTLAYMSPEQTGRTARVLDARTDLYALGVTLFEVLAGRRPFTEHDPLSLVHAHLAKEPPPLDELAPEVPKAVSAIVAKLLEKDPDRRYQTASGVAEDLSEAIRAWHTRSTVPCFELGTKDYSPKLRLPQVLVGREREIEQLGASFARVASGGVELVLIGGPSGIGKTALVRTVYREIAKAGRGTLIAGKHDQLARSTPYAAMAQAFGGLLRQWLSSPADVLRSVQELIRSEVGDNARLIADVVPELDIVLGKLADVAEVHGEQAQNRQKLTWLNFVRAVIAWSSPLVMFLDDMHWADAATLLTIETLLSDPERKELLVIAAYRDNEAPEEHPLWKLVETVGKSGALVSRISVAPLSEAEVGNWLSRALSSEPSQVAPLSRVLWQKTRGTPFFMERMLLTLHERGLVVRDPSSGAWGWRHDELERAEVTDNVVQLLTDKVKELPPATQHLLGLAACAGHEFHLQDLARLCGWDHERVAAALWPALEEELVVSTGGAYRAAYAPREVAGPAPDAEYRFLHDRVQQACYERISAEQRVLAHLDIGRRLWQRYRDTGGTGPALLTLVRHLNRGAERMESVEERIQLAELGLEAARTAMAASSYRLAASLLETAASLLEESMPRRPHELSVEIALERLMAAFLLRDAEDVDARVQRLLAAPLPRLARLRVQELQLRHDMATGQYARGREAGLAALAEQGITFPDAEEACHEALLHAGAELDQNLDQIERLPLDPSREHLLIDSLAASTATSAAFSGHVMLCGLIAARAVSRAWRQEALTIMGPLLGGLLAHLWSGVTGKYRQSARLLQPAVRAAERMSSPALGECLFLSALYMIYSRPADEARPMYERTVAIGLKSGSFQATGCGLSGELFHCVWRGLPLDQVDAQRKARRGLQQRVADTLAGSTFEMIGAYCEVLMAPESARSLLAEEPVAAGSRAWLDRGNMVMAEFARVHEAHVFLMAGAYTRALSRAREADQYRAFINGDPPVTVIPLWLALSSAKCWRPATDAEEQAELRDAIEHGLSRLRYFAEGCAANFLHMLRLIEAEYARVQGKAEEAMTKYDEAIALAREQKFLHIEALAAQFCAEFHLDAGRSFSATLYLREAKRAYARWGAHAVVAHLERTYAALSDTSRRVSADGPTTTTTSTGSIGGALLDVSTAVQAAQALSSELEPNRVVGRLMNLVMENAGAQRGVLLLREGDAFSVVARLSVQGARIETGLSEPLAESRDVPATVVQYVSRTSEFVLIGDARAEERFAADPYLASHEVRSVLTLPLTHRGHVRGVLYLEHGDVPSAFPAARVELLSVLASQAAIAVENALLYQNLETKVKDRTEELRAAKDAADRANQAKSDFLSSMSHELRTPLNSILGYAQILERTEELSPKVRESVHVIKKSGTHLLTLINDVLDLAKIEAGRMDLVPNEANLPAIVRTVVNLCRVRAEQKNIALSYQMPSSFPETVYTDEKRLIQVLLNLLGNAIKFTERGSVTLRVEALEDGLPSGHRMRFRVEDTGSGIAPAHLARIFEPFEQVGDVSMKIEGTGLGLAITKKIVTQMGGTIEVESELGRGSVFAVTLVLAKALPRADAGEMMSWDTIIGYEGARHSILVVDDNPDNRAVLRELLTPLGFDLSEVEHGEAALTAAPLRAPSLILMDLNIPGIDGHETTRRLRQMPELAKTVMIASSADVSPATHDKSLAAGCDDFLPKPLVAQTLLSALQRHLGLTWVSKEAPVVGGARQREGELTAAVAPSDVDLAMIRDLAVRGRIRQMLTELERLRERAPELGPWIAHVRGLASAFRLQDLRDFLQDIQPMAQAGWQPSE